MTGTAESGRSQTRRKEQVRKQSQRRSLGGKQQLRWMLKTAELGRAWSNKLAWSHRLRLPFLDQGRCDIPCSSVRALTRILTRKTADLRELSPKAKKSEFLKTSSIILFAVAKPRFTNSFSFSKAQPLIYKVRVLIFI